MEKIRSFFFETDSGRIFCTIVGDCAVSSKYCAIYFAPLFEERVWTQRVALNFAYELWDGQQIPTLFFDYYGYGESAGDHEEFTLQHSHSDIKMLIYFLNEKYGITQFIFWGIRTGCVVALSCLYKYQIDHISGVILWAPIIDLVGYIHQALIGTAASQYLIFKRTLAKRNEVIEETLRDSVCLRDGFVMNNIEGYRFGREFYLELQQLPPKELIATIQQYNTLALEVVPLRKTKKTSSKPKGNEELVYYDTRRIVNLTVSENEFWLNRLDYSQRADGVYQLTMKWIKETLYKKPII